MTDRGQVVVNTLVFIELLEKGMSQASVFQPLKDMGIQKIEVRREYIRDKEWNDIAKMKAVTNLEVLYSIPDTLFEKGRLKSSCLKRYISEANKLGATMIKFNRGDFLGWSATDRQRFFELANTFQGTITAENDQTPKNGPVDSLVDFLANTKEEGLPLYATFDVGNSFWVNEDPLENAKKISRFTKLVHLKDVKRTKAGPKTVLLGEGDVPWQDILSQFNPTIPITIEYPCGAEPFQQLAIELEKLIIKPLNK